MRGTRRIAGLAPSGKGDYTLHKTRFFYNVLMTKTGSLGDGKCLYNNDCHKEEDFHKLSQENCALSEQTIWKKEEEWVESEVDGQGNQIDWLEAIHLQLKKAVKL